jgi:hypothetical protein
VRLTLRRPCVSRSSAATVICSYSDAFLIRGLCDRTKKASAFHKEPLHDTLHESTNRKAPRQLPSANHPHGQRRGRHRLQTRPSSCLHRTLNAPGFLRSSATTTSPSGSAISGLDVRNSATSACAKHADRSAFPSSAICILRPIKRCLLTPPRPARTGGLSRDVTCAAGFRAGGTLHPKRPCRGSSTGRRSENLTPSDMPNNPRRGDLPTDLKCGVLP